MDIGPSIGFVHAAEPEDRSGLNPEQFAWLQQRVAKDIPSGQGLHEALEVLSDGSRDPEAAFLSLRRAGKFLLGAVQYDTAETPSGLLYVEASDRSSRGSFMQVKVGTWVLPEGVTTPEKNRLNSRGRKVIASTLFGVGLKTGKPPADPFTPHVPVDRLTQVIPLWEQDGNEVPPPYTYGHRKDKVQVAGLDVPKKVRYVLLCALQGAHSDELEQSAFDDFLRAKP